MTQPSRDSHQADCQERNVKTELRGPQVHFLLILFLFTLGQQVDQQRRKSALVENVGYVAIARAMARAATAVSEDHRASGGGRHTQLALQSGRLDFHLE